MMADGRPSQRHSLKAVHDSPPDPTRTSERIRIGEEYYILASALAPQQRREVLSHGDGFAIFDLAGDIPLATRDSYGFFYRDTRFLDRFELRLDGEFPVLLSGATSDDGSELVTYLTNSDQQHDGVVMVARDTVSLLRRKTLVRDTLYEQLQLHNYGQQTLSFELAVLFGTDFADMFEVRGTERARRGDVSPPHVDSNAVRLQYRGLDGVARETVLTFEPAPQQLTPNAARFRLSLGPSEGVTFDIRVHCRIDDEASVTADYVTSLARIRSERHAWQQEYPTLYSNNEGFNDWLNRSLADLALLRTEGPHGPYVYAGIPWFATVFGRDGLITALETLAFSPALAAGTLRTLAAIQGATYNRDRDEEPGKILHELRRGEMAALGEVPFARYYGSVDATPLFLVLLAEYAERTVDIPLVQELWPAAQAAMSWIDSAEDSAGGYTTYRRTTCGLVNQGWKDSHDAIAHADGALAEPPIALAEVQAYVYAARQKMAQLARRLGRAVDAAGWEDKAGGLRQRFNRDFWMEDEDAFALALDGSGRPCRVVSSNAGQCLFGGIADPEKAVLTMARLMREDMFCGWGIRTLSSEARRYNPMSYHNGSVWPHDNALIAAGFARCGACGHAARVLTALFDAALLLGDRRLPELFCGFARNLQHSPVPYPVACKPQAWSAGSVFLLLQATFGLHIDAWERRVFFDRAAPPPWLERLDIRGLRVREARVDLCITRGRFGAAAIEVVDKQGDVEVAVRK